MNTSEKTANIVIWSCIITVPFFYLGYELGKDFYHMIH